MSDALCTAEPPSFGASQREKLHSIRIHGHTSESFLRVPCRHPEAFLVQFRFDKDVFEASACYVVVVCALSVGRDFRFCTIGTEHHDDLCHNRNRAAHLVARCRFLYTLQHLKRLSHVPVPRWPPSPPTLLVGGFRRLSTSVRFNQPSVPHSEAVLKGSAI